VLNHRRNVAAAIAGAAAAALVSAACSGGTPSSTATVSSACRSAYQAWASGPHGTTVFDQISTDVSIVTTSLQKVVSSNNAASAVTQTFNAGSKLGADSNDAGQNLPPSCVPGLAGPYRTSLSDAHQAGLDVMAAMTALRAGNQSAATNSVNAFAANVGSAQVNIKAARKAVSKAQMSWP
jgi:hypothetical protein